MLFEKEVLLITNHRIIYVRKDLFGWQSDWILKWDEINNLRRVEQGIEITLEASKQKSTISKMFSSNEKPKKLLLIKNRQRCEKLFNVMASLHEKHKRRNENP